MDKYAMTTIGYDDGERTYIYDKELNMLYNLQDACELLNEKDEIIDNSQKCQNFRIIKELELIKSFYVNNINWTAYENMLILEYVNNRIKELKGE